ncbi:unnamed protein product [Caenorhabditis sp. 36 PRJEB53466]|nr:unnamed protein product [Caenorhabditis sp. 36 PRJEB53466]
MSMTYKQNDLTEEIFGHLCNVALHKCSDKTEKKRAGCGGRAMRKRVLIKNFVSDLFKMPKKPTSSREQDMASSDEEYDDFDMTDVSFYEEELEDFRLEDLTNSYEQQPPMAPNDLWLNQPSNLYGGSEMGFSGVGSGYGYESSSLSLMPSSYSAPSSVNYQPYDMYGSSMSESATEGDMPIASDPLASLSGMLPSSEPTSFDPYGQPSSSTNNSSYFHSDDFFLTNVAEHVFADTQVLQEDTHELTDLDVATGESHANKNKRRSTELFDDFNVSFQKRIKI